MIGLKEKIKAKETGKTVSAWSVVRELDSLSL